MRVRLGNLPPETPDEAVRFAFSQYFEIKEMQRGSAFKSYRYKVFNGVRIVVITLTKNISSYMTTAGLKIVSII